MFPEERNTEVLGKPLKRFNLVEREEEELSTLELFIEPG